MLSGMGRCTCTAHCVTDAGRTGEAMVFVYCRVDMLIFDRTLLTGDYTVLQNKQSNLENLPVFLCRPRFFLQEFAQTGAIKLTRFRNVLAHRKFNRRTV